jgi:hypothetical protein
VAVTLAVVQGADNPITVDWPLLVLAAAVLLVAAVLAVSWRRRK